MRLIKPIRPYTALLGLLLFASLLLFTSEHCADNKKGSKFSKARIEHIYEQLAVNSGQQDIPPLIILESPTVNAWTDGKTVVVTTAILGIFENEDQLAMVLSHEMAHAMNHDPERGYEQVNSNDTEAHADKLGAFLMLRAGFDVCKGKEVFRVMKALFGDTANPQGHPDFAYRLDQLDLPLCHNLLR